MKTLNDFIPVLYDGPFFQKEKKKEMKVKQKQVCAYFQASLLLYFHFCIYYFRSFGFCKI